MPFCLVVGRQIRVVVLLLVWRCDISKVCGVIKLYCCIHIVFHSLLSPCKYVSPYALGRRTSETNNGREHSKAVAKLVAIKPLSMPLQFVIVLVTDSIL